MKLFRQPLITAAILLIALLLIWSCAEMKGTQYTNQAPTVNFVNTPKDADPATATESWVYNTPFNIFSEDPDLYTTPHQMVQFPDIEVGDTVLTAMLVPDTAIIIKGFVDGDTMIYEEGIDYTILDSSNLTIQVFNPATVPNARMEATDAGGDTIPYFADFKLAMPNYYVFSFAPVVYWFGSDPDGFVEYYSYADIKYQDIEAQLGPGANPASYINMISPDQWIDTYTTSATVYLLSETGDTTEHVLYLRCFDNDDAPSPIVYRTFFRSNQPPNTPEIKWDEQSDDAYSDSVNIRVDRDTTINLEYYDNTLFCLEEITPIWNGIILRWRGDDPDDKELYTIPLTYQYYLISLDENDNPVDTLWDYSTYDETTNQLYFTDEQAITLVGLESGSYMFSVWSFDDGFESSPSPANLYFKCVKPLSENEKNSIILYDETVFQSANRIWELQPDNAEVDTFYVNMLAKMDSLFDGSAYDFDVDMNTIWNDQSGNTDVMYWDNSNASIDEMIPIDLLAKYKLLIMYADDHKTSGLTGLYPHVRDLYFRRYLEAGGRIWILGRCLFNASFGENGGQQFTSNELLNMMQVQEIYVYRFLDQPREFIGAFNAVSYLDTLTINKEMSANLFGFIIQGDTTLPEVDWMGRDEDATTLYYFNSITGGQTQVSVDSGEGYVMDNSDTPPFPMPSGSQCWVNVDDENLISVSSVINLDKMQYGNGIGEVVVVTSDDDILVNYPQIDLNVEENADVCAAPEPTPNACCILTSRYDQDFSNGSIYNVTRQSEGTAVSIDNYEVQVSYEIDTVSYNDPDVTVLTAASGYFDPTPDSCAVELSKNFSINVQSVTNNTQGQSGTILSRITNVVIVGTNGVTWAAGDDVDAVYDYLEYWEPGDQVEVEYVSTVYWEKGDDVLVDYIYNPTSDAHLKPCAIRYEYYEVYNFTVLALYYRTAVFTFPLSFMNNYNSVEEEQSGELGRVDKVFYEMLDWFLYPNVHSEE